MEEEGEELTLTVTTEIEDRELKDIRDDNESNKTPAAKAHCNDFLEILCKEKCKNVPVLTIDDLPYLGLGDHGDYQSWWHDFFGKFFNYLTFNAHKYRNPKNDLISYESATGHASAIKSFIENRFRNKTPLNVLDENGSWRKLRNAMRKSFNSQSRQTGKRVVNPRIASSREDRAAMANACFWLASTESAEFLCLNVWTCHLLGRGREASFLKAAEDIGSVETNDQEIEYEVLGVNIQRDKTGLVQDLNLCPHKHAIQAS